MDGLNGLGDFHLTVPDQKNWARYIMYYEGLGTK